MGNGDWEWGMGIRHGTKNYLNVGKTGGGGESE